MTTYSEEPCKDKGTARRVEEARADFAAVTSPYLRKSGLQAHSSSVSFDSVAKSNPAISQLPEGIAMTEAKTKNAALQWKLLVKKRNSDPRRVPPGKESLTWITNTVALLYGERDAMLVDTFLPNEQNQELPDWIAASGKNLTMVYITHAHPDHFCGLKLLLDRFPGARAVAPPQVVKAMHATIAPDVVKNTWERLWPGQLPKELIAADVLESKEFELEGHKVVVVDTGHTDTDHSTCLHVPSIDLVISGDAVYNGAHLYLAESNKQGRLDWLGALDKIEALKPRAVIAGHGVLKPDSDLRHIQATRQYLLDFNRLDESTTTARELYDKMLELYPDRVNPGSLWGVPRPPRLRDRQPYQGGDCLLSL